MASLKDVAKLAGVSIATASRVINNSAKVNDLTRKKVDKAIKELDFKPSRVAQRLRVSGGKKKIIGLILPDIQNPFYVDVIRGVEDIAYSNGYVVLMGNFAQDESKEKMYIDLMQTESVDGLILAPVHEKDEKVINLVKNGVPVVCVDRGLSDLDVDIIVVDNEDGSYRAIKYLIERGHTRIAYIGGLEYIPTTRQRELGYRRAFQDSGIAIDNRLIQHGDSKHESGSKLTNKVLGMEDPPTALFTGNNLITLGALEAIHERGLRIPNDVAIIGFDDMPWAISLNPPLTAVSQPGYEIGRRAADILFQRIDEPDREYVKLVLKTKLILRKSC